MGRDGGHYTLFPGLLQEDCKLDALAVVHTSVKLAQQLGGEERVIAAQVESDL
ncbi:uncharacterized protein G2W53_007181 [Senna tora]|uniref:Uncharacterized protein n=1 Tax=Senna tora TaxID=362788 RepID=A0A834X6N1_9FABA|nr:uncharacterized protein G2W53_007181 [Senna tora]